MSSAQAPTPIPGILRLAWPLIISFALRAAFTWVDRIYAAFLPDPDVAQAAIGLAQPIEFLLLACWVGSSNGLTSRLSTAMGAREGGRVAQLLRATRKLIWFLVALFLVVAGAIWIAAPRLGLEVELARGFQVYGAVLIGGSALTAFWAILPDSLVKAHQDTHTTMWAGLLSSLVNILLNTLFVFVFHWGLFGIALSTALGRLGGLAYSLWRARQHEGRRIGAGLDVVPGAFRRPLRAILAIAVPSGLTYVLMSLEGFAVNGLLANSYRHLGLATEALRALQADALAAWSIFSAAVSLLAMPAIATGVAMLPLAARLKGARQELRLQREYRVALGAWLGVGGLVVAPLAFFLWPWICEALLESPQAIEFALFGRWVLPLAMLVLGPFVISRPLFDALARSQLGLGLSAARSLLLIVPATYVGGRLALEADVDQIVGLYWGYALGAALGTLAVILSTVRLIGWRRRGSAWGERPARGSG